MKLISYITAGALALALPAFAEIKDADFKAAFEKYIATEDGQSKISTAMQNYMQAQQLKAQKDAEARQQAELEEQFKNPVKIDIGNSPVKGPANAKVTIVEFSDFECPYCSRGASTMEEVLKAYPNDVKLVFKNLPLSFHKNAEPAARAALAANKQGKFWEFHDALFKNQRGLNQEYYEATAKALGLDLAKFKTDMESEEAKKQVQEDMAAAEKVGVSGTPGFSVGGVMVRGAYPIDHFKQIIDKWLAKK